MTFSERFLKLLESDGDLAPYLRLGARGISRKRQTQVPDIHRTDASKNSNVEKIRSHGAARKSILSNSDVEYIMNTYGIKSIQPGERKQLGTSKMNISICPVSGKYMLSKHE
jgi:hypothetical protein